MVTSLQLKEQIFCYRSSTGEGEAGYDSISPNAAFKMTLIYNLEDIITDRGRDQIPFSEHLAIFLKGC